MADTEKKQIGIETFIDQLGLKNGLKDVQAFIKDFAKGAAKEIKGLEEILNMVAGSGPAALGTAFAKLGQQAEAAFNEMTAFYREQERVELALQNAAKNNPYLNDRSIQQLTRFTDEMQKITGMDNVAALQTAAKLANLGRSQEQIQKIVKTAADMAAAGVMNFNEAVTSLSDTYTGVLRIIPQLRKELGDLSKGSLVSGEAIDFIAGKVLGQAEEAMKNGTGIVGALKNVTGNLAKTVGERWESIIKGPRDVLTNLVNWSVDGVNHIKATLNWQGELNKSKASVQAIDKEINAIRQRTTEDQLNEIMSISKAEEEASIVQIRQTKDRQISAEEFKRQSQEALDAEIEKILQKAEIEGKTNKDLSVKKQILDAQLQTYKNLLVAANGVINDTASAEKERFASLIESWKTYEKQTEREKCDDEGKKQRLQELARLQQEIQASLIRVYDKVQGEAKSIVLQVLGIGEGKQGIEDLVNFGLDTLKRQLTNEAEERKAAIEHNLNVQMDALDELEAAELEKYTEISQVRAEVERQFDEERKKLKSETSDEILQIEANLADEIERINDETGEKIKLTDKELLQERINNIQEYIDRAASVVSLISEYWNDYIDRQTEKELEANNNKIQSDEDRTAAEKKILMEAAQQKYKADLFAWGANVTLMTATMAVAALTAYSEGLKGGGPAATVLAAIQQGMAIATGVAQIAAAISAKPKPPSFHTGGVVQGKSGQEVNATLLAGEKVTTSRQFGDIMQAFANMANMKGGGEGMNVQVINNASNKVEARPTMTAEGLKLVVTEITKEGFADGSFDHSLAIQQTNSRGISIT
jgi:hypothetical protein